MSRSQPFNKDKIKYEIKMITMIKRKSNFFPTQAEEGVHTKELKKNKKKNLFINETKISREVD